MVTKKLTWEEVLFPSWIPRQAVNSSQELVQCYLESEYKSWWVLSPRQSLPQKLLIDGWACSTVPHNFPSCLSCCHRALTTRTPVLHLPPLSVYPSCSLPLFLSLPLFFFSLYPFPIRSPFSRSCRALAWLSRSDRRIPLVFTILKPLSCSDSLLSPATSQLWLHTSLGSHCLLTDHCHFPSCSLLMVPPSSAALTPPIPTPTPSRQACASPLPYQCNYFFDKPSISLNFKSTLHWYPLLSLPLQLLPSLPPDRPCMREYDIRHHQTYQTM